MPSIGKTRSPRERLALAQDLFASGDVPGAALLCRDLIGCGEPLGALWGEVAELCRCVGDDDGAVLAAQRYLADSPDDPARRAVLAERLAAIDDVDGALRIVDDLVKRYPTATGAIYAAGFFHSEKGAFDEATAYYRRALELDPAYLHAWEQIVRLKTFETEDADYRALRRLADDTSRLAPLAQAQLFYALGKAEDDLGRTTRAFAAYAQGAAAMRRQAPFRIDAFEAYCQRLTTTFGAARVEDWRGGGLPSNRPILIVGMPRSGTTLVEQIFASHPEVTGGGEIKCLRLATYPLANLEAREIDAFLARHRGNGPDDPWAALGQRYLALLSRRFGAVGRVTDKNLGNHLLLGALRLMLPNARIIYCRRDPLDTAWSCFKTRFFEGQFWSYDLETIARYSHSYERLMDHWKGLWPDAILDVHYEALIARPDAEIARMLDFCGLPDASSCLQFHKTRRVVATASLAQVRRPLYARSIGSWKRFEAHLQPLIDALGEGARPGAVSAAPGMPTVA